MKGQPELKWNKDLLSASEKKVQDMKDKEYFSHQNGKGETVTTLVPKEYKYYAIGENLASGFSTEEQVVAAWMKSPKHRANILDSDYRDTAISVRESKNKPLIVEVFGVRQDQYLQERSGRLDGVNPQVQGALQITFYASTGLFILVALLLVVRKLQRRA